MKRKITKSDILFGKKIRAARDRSGKSRREIGEALNITGQQISKYESATDRISAGKLVDLARALEIDFFEIIPEEFLDLHKIDNDALCLWKRLSPENKILVINVIREMVE